MNAILLLFVILFFSGGCADEISFVENYSPMWGGDHVTVVDHEREVQLRLDEHSGAGFISKENFGSGYFRMMMKLPSNHSQGVIVTFYLTSIPLGENGTIHDELDFEFLGGNDSMPYRLSTNVFANDWGHREQVFRLWFDPTTNFHTYELIWNQYQIVFLVDEIPIRVFKNNTKIGVSYPSKSMHIEASIWNSTSWVGQVEWNNGPFIAHYQGFSVDGCKYNASDPKACYSMIYYWNAYECWQLGPRHLKSYQDVRNKFMIYDYCSNHSKKFPECLTDFPEETGESTS